MQRERYWSKSSAVGDKDWLEKLVNKHILKRQIIMKTNSVHYLSGAKGGFSK